MTDAPERTSHNVAKRWTPKLVVGGWTPISTYFIDNYHRLDPALTSQEAILVVHLMRHKWDEKHPFPTFATLARRMGISPTAARGHARSLEKKRYLNRIPTQGSSNQFDLIPLFDALERMHLADEEAGRIKPSSPRRVRTGLGVHVDGESGSITLDSLNFKDGQVLDAETLNLIVSRLVNLEKKVVRRRPRQQG